MQPSNISTNNIVNDVTAINDYFKFESEFAGTPERPILEINSDINEAGNGNNVVRAEMSLYPPLSTIPISEHIIEKNGSKTISTGEAVKFGEMSFRMLTDEPFDIEGFKLKENTYSPTTGIKVNLDAQYNFNAKSTFRFTDVTASKDADLANLVVSSGDVNEENPDESSYKEYNLDPIFDKEINDYTLTLLEYLDTINITATQSDENASMKIKVPKRDSEGNLVYESDGTTIIYEEKDLSNTTPTEITLNKLGEPDTEITVKVTAEDGATQNAYKIVIKRPYGTIKGVEITGEPEKIAYNWGDTLELDGLTITEKYPSEDKNIELTDPNIVIKDITTGTEEDLNMSPDKSEFASGDTVTKTIKVTYTADETHSDTTTFQITIKNNKTKIEMGTTPTKTEYNINDISYDLENTEGKNGKGDIIVTYQAGNTEVVALDEEGVALTDLSTLTTTTGTNKKVTVTYGTDKDEKPLTTSFNIDVVDGIVGAEIEGEPTKKAYNWGDSIDYTGMKIYTKYASTPEGSKGTEVTIPNTKVTIEDVTDEANAKSINMSPDKSEFARGDTVTKTIKVTYTADETHSDTTTFQITIKNNKTKIEMGTTPTKTEYNINDTSYDLTNTEGKNGKGDIIVTYQAGNTEVVALDEEGVALTDLSTLTTTTGTNKKVTVTYGTDKDRTPLTTSFNIDVVDAITGVTVTGTAVNTAYNHGETLDFTGISIYEQHASDAQGSKGTLVSIENAVITDITDGETGASNATTNLPANVFASNNTVTRKIRVQYTSNRYEDHIDFDITVKNILDHIEIATFPKTSYEKGDSIANAGGTIKIYRKADTQNSTETINITDDMITGLDTKEVGQDFTATVTYKEEDIHGNKITAEPVTYKYNVTETVQSITLNPGPDKTEYTYGENIDLTGAYLDIVKGNGTTERVAVTENMISGYDNTPNSSDLPSTQTITVTYGKYADGTPATVTFTVTVEDEVIGILLTPPEKTTYKYGEELDLTGGFIQKVMASGKEIEKVSLEEPSVEVTGFDPKKIGPQTIKVTYEGETKTFPVIVEENVISIKIIDYPKQNYEYGENLDVTGGRIEVTRENGDKETIPMTESMVSGFNPNQPGTQTLTVTYGGQKDFYDIEVTDDIAGIKITPPKKLVYSIGEKIDLTGGKVSEVTASGNITTPVDMTLEMISGFDTSSEGAKTITVIYKGKTATFNIIVVDPLSDIQIITLPNKLTYKYGENLDVAGGTIQITKESGKKQTINMTPDMITGYNPNKVGQQTLTVTYEGITKEFIVTVEDYVTKLIVKAPNKTEYEYGQDLNLEGGKVSIIMASGAVEENVEMTASMLTGYNKTQEGLQTIKVEYKGLQGNFQVKVIDKIKGISINTLPNKTDYKNGENLDLTGGTITVVKSSGTQTITITKDMVSGYNPKQPGTQVITINYGGFTTEFVVTVANKTSTSNNTITIEEPIIEEEIIEEPITSIEEPIIETPKLEEPIIEKPTEVLGVKDEQNNNSGKILAGCIGAIGLVFLLILIVFKRNVKVYVFEDGEFVLGGKDRITKKNPRIDIDKFLDEGTYPNQVKIRLSDWVSEKLDRKEIEINHRGKTIKHTIKYNNEEYEIILK